MKPSYSQHTFDDFDALRQHLEGWDTVPVQLSRGCLHLRWSELAFADMRIALLNANQVIADTVTIEPDWYVFVICFGHKSFCGIPVQPGSIVVFGPGRTYRNVLESDWSSFEISLHPSVLEPYYPSVLQWSLKSLAPEQAVLPLSISLASDFKRFSEELFLPTHSLNAFREPELLGAIKDRTLGLLGMALSERDSCLDNLPMRRPSYRLVEQALSYIDSRLEEDKGSVVELVHELQCSRRALELAFREIMDCSPYQYFMARRLGKVRHTLLNKRDAINVTQAAYQEGFTHLGRFAAQYNRFYGEPPSKTLSRFRSRNV